ncbi:MAG: hypothetical protein PHS14_13435, partial [Elusimicrobia bacterium]|nr:hypothetical protein [Elusimicrobiota bacterium]
AASLKLGKNDALPASGRSALRLCLDDARLRGKTVLLPDFLCAEAILPALEAAGARAAFYPVGEDLRPDMPRLLELSGRAAATVFLDYFGFGESEEWAKAVRKARPKAVLISDWVQSLHLLRTIPPARQTSDYAFTSLRKFLPVPDGAVVRARRPLRIGLNPAPAEAGLAALGAGTLKREFLEGRTPPEAEAAYVRLFASARRELSTRLESAAPVSLALAEALPLAAFAAARRANYAALASALSGAAVRPLRPILSARAVPLFLPVAVPDGRRDALRAFLRGRGIFAPVHWTLPASLSKGASGRLSRSVLSLPVDQRCGAAEIARVADAVLDFERSLR